MAARALTRRVVAGSAAVLALVAVVGAALVVTDLQLRDTARHQDDELSVARQADARMLAGFVDEETGLRGYLLTGDATFLAPYDRAGEALPSVMDRFAASFAASGGPAQLARDLRAAHDAWSHYADGQIARAAQGQLEQARASASTAQGKQLFDAIRAADQRVSAWLDGASRRTQDRLGVLQQRLSVLLIGSLAALVLVVVGGCAVLWRSVARPLARLAAATRVVAGGDLAAELPVAGAPEIRSLADDMRAMRDRLTADLHTAQRGAEALEQTGPAVTALRAALEPSEEHVPGLVVAGRLDPAEGVLAGDWYDAVALGPTRLALVLGDVAGHGPAAAVFGLRLKHSLMTGLRSGLAPGQALTQLSGELVATPPGEFATAFVAVFDTATDTLTYANAGHPAGLLGGAAGWDELRSTGPLLSSIVHGWAWNTASRPFRPGNALLACTDGVLEARDDGGAEFGTPGILAALAEVAGADAERVVDAVAAASMRFGGNRPRRDDSTVVFVRRLQLSSVAVASGRPGGAGA